MESSGASEWFLLAGERLPLVSWSPVSLLLVLATLPIHEASLSLFTARHSEGRWPVESADEHIVYNLQKAKTTQHVDLWVADSIYCWSVFSLA